MKSLKNSFLGTVFLLALGSSSLIASQNNSSSNMDETISFHCVTYTLSCGYSGSVCDMDELEDIEAERDYWENELC